MAVYTDQKQQQDKAQAAKAPAPVTPGAMTLGGGGASSAPNGGAPSAPAAPQGSGRFTNLQKYLDANKTGGQRIANNIQNNFNKQANTVQSGIQNAQQTLEQKANPLSQQLQTGQQTLKQGFIDPNAVLNDQQKLADFRNLQQGYGTNINNVATTEAMRQQQLAGQANQLADTANLAGTEQGRFQLLRNTMGANPMYSQGAQRLDQVLLGSQGNAAANLQQGLKNTTDQATQGISALELERNNKINALKGMSNERVNEWNSLLDTGLDANAIDANINQRGLSDIYASSQQRLAAANAEAADMPALRQRLATNTLTNQDIQKLGLTKGAQLYDANANDYITQTNYIADMQNTAAKDEVQRYNALQQLAGMQNNANPFGDGSKAETYKAYNYDNAGFNAGIAGRKNEYEVNRVNNIVDELYGTVGGRDGARMGGGMRAAVSDAARHYQATLPRLLTGLNADNTTFENVQNIANQAYAGSGGIAGAAQSRYRNSAHSLQELGAQLNQLRGNVLGANAVDAAPAAAPAPVDWAAIRAEMASKGYK